MKFEKSKHGISSDILVTLRENDDRGTKRAAETPSNSLGQAVFVARFLISHPRRVPPSPRVHIFGESTAVTSALEQSAIGVKCSQPFLDALGVDVSSTDLPYVVRKAEPLQEGPVLGMPTYDLEFPQPEPSEGGAARDPTQP